MGSRHALTFRLLRVIRRNSRKWSLVDEMDFRALAETLIAGDYQ